MDIKQQKVTIRELHNGYINNNEEGVLGYGGKLNIRPKYQREFIYKEKQQELVIDTVKKHFPLNTIYWADNGDGTYELLDGQQRTLSICRYIDNKFSINHQYFHNLTETEKENILDYELMIYLCKGNDKAKLEWFKVINIAGLTLTAQELRNAIYTGEWLTHAKKHFSKTNCVADTIGGDWINGSPIRQDYLEKVIKWISNGQIENYMAEHQSKQNANELWLYFQAVISWIQSNFKEYRKEMKSVDWGFLYNRFKSIEFDTAQLEIDTKRLMMDDEVTKKSGIYEYLLTKDKRFLNLRAFTKSQKRLVFEKQNKMCLSCREEFKIDEMEADHIMPWSQGGKTDLENCQMLCKKCNRIKGIK